MLRIVKVLLLLMLFAGTTAQAGFVKITNNFKIENGKCYQEHIYDDEGPVWESFDCIERLKQSELMGQVYSQLIMYRDLRAQGHLSDKAYEHFFTEAVAIQQHYGERITERKYNDILDLLQSRFQEAQEMFPITEK